MTKCPQCGYEEVKSVKRVSNVMNIYVDAETGKVDGAYNADVDTMTIKGRKLIRQELFEHKPIEKKEEAPASPNEVVIDITK